MIYLVYVEGLRGPEPQLWHKEKPSDHFVTPSDVKVVAGPTLVPALWAAHYGLDFIAKHLPLEKMS